jgi:predicted ATPase/DNA-binding CsgD family transcriptional regulator
VTEFWNPTGWVAAATRAPPDGIASYAGREPGLRERPAAGTAADGMHGFAPALTSFIGRTEAINEIAGLVGEYRLVTVTGPGGAGKTRLAGQVAERVAGRFADGVWLAELAAVRDPALVAAAVAVALRVRDVPGVSAAEELARMLARQQLLLVLDNCEHVIDAAAALCAGLLPACDDVRVLATSREPLRVAGEARYRLPPLTVSQPGGGAAASGSEAVSLFVDRARRVNRHFALDPESGPVVAQLVARLDGMPLAIELAAARVESLGVNQLLDRLDDRFALLADGDRSAVARHRSLAATVDWSYQLLSEEERRVFRRLSVFPGAFTLQAAETVADPGAEPAVLHLVDCSLISPPRADPDGRARYLMLETLRAYGAGRLREAGEQSAAASKLAEHAFVVAAQAAEDMQTGAGELAAARWLDAEDATMQQALTWAAEHEPGLALRLAVALAPWWTQQGRMAVGYPLLRVAAERAGRADDAWPAAQYWLGRAANLTGEFTAALTHYAAASNAVEQNLRSPILADAAAGRANCLLNLGRTAEAAEEAHRALHLAQEIGYPAGEARALVNLFLAAEYSGDTETALRWARQATRIDQRTVPGMLARQCNHSLADILVVVGDVTAAEVTCMGELDRARQAGDLFSQSFCLDLLAELDQIAGRIPQAAEHLREALEISMRIGDRLRLIDCLDNCGHLCAATQRWADAATLWAAFTSCLRELGMSDMPSAAERRREPMLMAEQSLGPGRMRAAGERAAAMTLATAAEFAILLTVMHQQSPQTPPGLEKLSPRERELITLVARGRTDAQIAAQLRISVRTVSSHLDRVRDKTSCRRRADLTRLALSAGLV